MRKQIGMLWLRRRRPQEAEREPLFHPPRGPYEVSDRIDAIDIALEHDRKKAGWRAAFAALSLAGFAGNSNVLGVSNGDPVQRISVWSDQDRFER